MEEDEEVDIVGGYDDLLSKNEREISNISSGQILSCEYTVHPLWLNDANDGTELWPENLPKQSSQDEMEMVQDEVVIEEPAPIDFNWCEEQEHEETSTCGDIILEQDIPASLEEEVVTNSGTEADENSDYCSQSPDIERKIKRMDSDGKPQSNVIWSHNPASLLRSNFVQPKPLPKFKQKLLVNKKLLKLNQYNFNTNQSAGTSLLKPKFQRKVHQNENAVKKLPATQTKFKQSVTLMKRDLPASGDNKLRTIINKLKKKQAEGRRVKSKQSKCGKYGGKMGKSGKCVSVKASGKTGGKILIDMHGENITINHDADDVCIQSNKLSESIAIQSEIVKVKHETDSDVEVDIVSDSSNDFTETKICDLVKQKTTIEQRALPPIDELKPKIEIKMEEKSTEIKSYSNELAIELETMKPPEREHKIVPNAISELEKYFHSEFFEGRPTKTPERYLKIRDFILNSWYENRPTYVSKTTVRNGLKHCGDVNCISRIHCMLEQIAAINFGHGGDQFDYIRPLSLLKEQFAPSTRNKSTSSSYETIASSSLGRRNRLKSFSTSSSNEKDIDANYTLSHVSGVPTLVFTTNSVQKERENRRESNSRPVKVEFELIECLHFTKEKIQPFKVTITLSTLLCMQLHALSCKYEIMGFLGGFCTKTIGRNKLSITRYKPCKTESQSSTTCEMCPVSQVEQVSNLANEGYDLLGWFHSHPTFEPNPSRTDVATQADMQQQFSSESDRPFIGFILGCIDMRFNCMYILPKDLHRESNELIPYKFDVDIIKEVSSLKHEIADVFNVIDRSSGTYYTSIEMFTRTADNLLHQYGYNTNILEYIRNYL